MAVTPFTPIEEEFIVAAIRYAEHKTSGELRVHVEANCISDPYQRAIKVFEELKMHETAQKNGVLIYLAFQDKKFAIIGDTGIHQIVGSNYWDRLNVEMKNIFAEGYIASGLVHAICSIGHQLSSHFPYLKNDENELSDEISFA